MSSGAIVGLLFFGFFGWIILACVFISVGLRAGSLRTAHGKAGMVFRNRISGRIGSAMMGTLFGIGVPIQYGQGLIYTVQRHQPVPGLAYFALLWGILIGGGFGGLLLFLAGPRNLFLELDRHTYRFVSGWPLFPRVQTGSWEDMAGVYVRCVSSRRSQAMYLVEIAWRQKRRSCPQLGRFGSEDPAEALAEEMVTVLGVPRIVPPPLGQTWVSPGSLTLVTKSEARPYRPFRPTLYPPPDVSEPKANTE